MVWNDVETKKPYCPFSQYPARFDVINSPLTEYAGMGFEYGYSWEAPTALVLWEAQYGDFHNGAQTIVDQYLAAAEEKWLCYSSLVLLLPHGFEGSGPEHASARPERFLQLAAQNNIRVVIPTTPAQYFHILRKQALCKVKRPLVLFTPKSLLRAPACTSPYRDFSKGTFFETIIDAPTANTTIRRLILCSGKVYYDLIAEKKRDDVAIVRIEQLYPLDLPRLQSILAKYKGAECVWVQEDPENMGAWRYIRPYLPNPIYVGREASATVATGSNRKHKQEQKMVIEKAFA
jgi:2-oxoglutarate dehydrogenase E1 component